MSCDGNRIRYFNQLERLSGGLIKATVLETRYIRHSDTPPGTPAKEQEAKARTLRLFADIRQQGLKPPTHSKSGFPARRNLLAYASCQKYIEELLSSPDPRELGEAIQAYLREPDNSETRQWMDRHITNELILKTIYLCTTQEGVIYGPKQAESLKKKFAQALLERALRSADEGALRCLAASTPPAYLGSAAHDYIVKAIAESNIAPETSLDILIHSFSYPGYFNYLLHSIIAHPRPHHPTMIAAAAKAWKEHVGEDVENRADWSKILIDFGASGSRQSVANLRAFVDAVEQLPDEKRSAPISLPKDIHLWGSFSHNHAQNLLEALPPTCNSVDFDDINERVILMFDEPLPPANAVRIGAALAGQHVFASLSEPDGTQYEIRWLTKEQIKQGRDYARAPQL